MEYAQEKLRTGAWKTNRIAFLDPDQSVYNGARFCEPNMNTFRDDRIGFFNAIRGDSQTGGIVEGDLPKRAIPGQEQVFKTFHPKSFAHGRIADRVRKAIERSAAIASEPGVQPQRIEDLDMDKTDFHW